MRQSLSQKLVLAFLGLTLLVLVATLGLARWSFQQGFLDYVNAVEQTRLESLRDVLVEEYASSGNSWEGLTRSRFVDADAARCRSDCGLEVASMWID